MLESCSSCAVVQSKRVLLAFRRILVKNVIFKEDSRDFLEQISP